MKEILHTILCMLSIQLLVSGCEEDSPRLGAPPTQEEARFTYTATVENDNIISFTNTAPGFMKVWNFGNGSTGKGDNVTGTFPTKGTYEVSLTVYNQGGSAVSTQTLEIAETDPTLLDIPFYNYLTGGADNPEGKTWVVDKNIAGHLGVGPAEGTWPEWYSASPNEKEERGLYDDEMTFKLKDFIFEYEANGTIYVNAGYGTEFSNAQQEPGGNDFLVPYTAPAGMTWTAAEVEDGKWELKINGGHLGYYSGASPTYEVISLTENELYIRSVQGGVPANVWYQRFVPEGFTSEPEPEPAPLTTALPVDFESAAPPFNGFGGSTYAVINNPDASGLNTSAKVGEYVKGTEGNWAGLETALEGMLDFSTNTLIKYKVYSPVTGRALFKLESVDKTAEPVEVFADITKTGEWQELTFDFSGTPSGTYNKIALFLDFDNNNGGTFYIDDIRQAAEMAVLTEEALTGGASKTWVLKPAAGSFGVGPAKGSDEWFPNGVDLSAVRPCLFNDEFIFKAGGEYEYDSKGDVYGEGYMGMPEDGCTDESSLPADAQAWGSGTHSFTFNPATETDPAYITVAGTGAFIALPKAYNNGEYLAGPPTTDGSVTYEVISYIKNGTSETLSLTITVNEEGTTFWNFVLVAQ